MRYKNKNANLYLLLSGQFASQLGDKFYALALSLWVLKTTNSPSMMGISVFFSILPSVLLGLISGSFIDKYNRKLILIITDIFRGIIISGIIFAYYLGVLNMAVIVTASILLSINSAFFDPTVFTIVPMFVKSDNLVKTNSRIQFIRGFTSIVGPVIGGIAVAGFGYVFAFIFNAASFFFSALLEGMLDIPQAKSNTFTKSSIKENLIEGYRYILARKSIIVILFVVAIVHFFVGLAQIAIPVLAVKLAGNGAQNLGYIETFFGIGTVAMAFFLSIFNISSKEVKVLFSSIFAIGLIYVVIGAFNRVEIKSVLPFLPLFFLLSSSIIAAGTCFQAILQKNVENSMAGRVFGITGSIGNFTVPAASLISGFLLNYFSPFYLLVSCGAAVMLASVLLYGISRGRLM